MAQAPRVLVADDEKNIRATLALCLEGMGCEVTGVASAAAALDAARRQAFDLVFLDLKLGDADALDVLPQLLARSPGVSVVIITAYATIETAVQAMKLGASDYLPKPFTPAEIRHVVGAGGARSSRACAARPARCGSSRAG
jgi:NtrC-family two-component system response regulator AlgB